MNLFGLLQISGSALLAQRERAEISASNLANADTTRTIDGGPYKRQNVIFAANHPLGSGFAATLASFADLRTETVRVAGVVQDESAPVRRYDPGHPDADADRLRELPERQSGRGKRQPHGSGAVLPVECFGAADDQGHDSIRHFDRAVARRRPEEFHYGQSNSRLAAS